MAYIDSKQPGRTVHNCTVYDARKVYALTVSMRLDVVQSVYGTGEVEKTGEKVTEVRVYHVLAKSEAMARALFAEKWGNSTLSPAVLVSVDTLFTIDGEISHGHH